MIEIGECEECHRFTLIFVENRLCEDCDEELKAEYRGIDDVNDPEQFGRAAGDSLRIISEKGE